ncbi:MAG: DUF1554 domain-containing protein [Nannocystaceae bacterium]|nr:DUF1554 domain-containing protein [bacterium]
MISICSVLALAPGCFSPEEEVESINASGEDGSTGGTGSESTAGPTTGSDPTGDPTTASPTTGDPTTDPTEDPSGDPTTDPTEDPTEDPTVDPTSGGEDPFCGDGNVDPGEECDDGLDNNGLDQSCLPDCNLNVCGDGNLAPDEFCDDGEGNNVLEVGACAPDCSRVIEEKEISFSSTFEGGNLQPNPVGFADGQCPAGTLALFSVAGVRQATNGTPFEADAMMDWPLQPYTAYVRSNGDPIWMTESVPLLGVRDGGAEPLENPVGLACSIPPCLVYGPGVTGLNSDWTTALSDNCNGWTSNTDASQLDGGVINSTTEFLASGDTVGCSLEDESGVGFQLPRFYCVEQ